MGGHLCSVLVILSISIRIFCHSDSCLPTVSDPHLAVPHSRRDAWHDYYLSYQWRVPTQPLYCSLRFLGPVFRRRVHGVRTGPDFTSSTRCKWMISSIVNHNPPPQANISEVFRDKNSSIGVCLSLDVQGFCSFYFTGLQQMTGLRMRIST